MRAISTVLSLGAFAGGLVLLAVQLHVLTTYGAPNPGVRLGLWSRSDFWLLLLGVALFASGAVWYFLLRSPDTTFRRFLTGFSPSAVVSVLLSSLTLLGIPWSGFVGPWDVFERLLLSVSWGVLLLVAFVLAIFEAQPASLFRGAGVEPRGGRTNRAEHL